MSLWKVKFPRDTPNNSACVAMRNFRGAALEFSSHIALFFEHSALVGLVFESGYINIFQIETKHITAPLQSSAYLK